MKKQASLYALFILLVYSGFAVAEEARTPNENALPGTAVWDVAIAPVLSKPISVKTLWGENLPDKLNVAVDLPRLSEIIAAGGYLVGAIDEGASKVPWSQQPDTCRAVVLPDQTLLNDANAERLRGFVKAGGIVIAFGHASLLKADGAARPEYLLADLFGVHSGGKGDSNAEQSAVTFSADSVFAPQYGPENVVDGGKSFWASKKEPMPHWVRMDFAQPKSVARVDVTCRTPSYMLVDFDVQTPRDEDWLTVASVRGNDKPKISCVLDKPVEIKTLRVLVLKESCKGEDRPIADIGELELYDPSGRKLISPPYLIEAHIADDVWIKNNRSPLLRVRSPFICIVPRAARPVALFPAASGGSELPLCTINEVGKGKAYMFAIPEGPLCSEPELWEALLRSFVGMPAVRHSGDEKFHTSLSRTDGAYLLRITDQDAVRAAKAKDRQLIVRANCSVLGPISLVKELPAGKELTLKRRGDWIQFFLPLQATATVRLEQGTTER